MIAPNAIAHVLEDPKGNEVRGPEEFKSAFPAIRIRVEEVVSEGGLVIGYCKIKATYGCRLWKKIRRQASRV